MGIMVYFLILGKAGFISSTVGHFPEDPEALVFFCISLQLQEES